MLKKLILATVLAVAPVTVIHACDVSYMSTSEAVHKAMKRGWGFTDYEAICRKLNAANAALQISADTTVLGGVSIAWVSVSLKDKNLDVFAPDFGGVATSTNSTPSMGVAQNILPQTISDAVNSIDLDRAIASLNTNRKKVRAAYQKK